MESYVIRVRSHTDVQWSLANPILKDGEPGYVTDLQKYKVGDGVTVWNSLPYASGEKGDPGPQGDPGPSGADFTPVDADARYVLKAGDIMTGPLTVSNLADWSGAILENVDGLTEWRLIMAAGSAYIWVVINGQNKLLISVDNSLVQTFGNASGPAIIASSSLTVPSPSGAGHAPRLGRSPDPVTGDLGQRNFHGSDTGVREISNLLTNGWTAAKVYLRRESNTVELVFEDLNGTSATSDPILSLPSGFKPNSIRGFPSGAIGTNDFRVGANGIVSSSNRVSGMTYSFTWLTVNDWPSALSGTQISPPVSWS